ASVAYAIGLIGIVSMMTFVLGFGAMVLVGQDAIKAVAPGGNMAAPLLAEVVGGRGFLGFISAVAFATILAVVAGLTLSGAAALSHDLWVHAIKRGHADEPGQPKVARLASWFLGPTGIAFGILLKGQNVAYMVGLAFAIAASANFPALILSMVWRRFTTSGAVVSMLTGAGSALVLIFLSPTVQVEILHRASAPFPLKNPALITVPLAFLAGVVTSLAARERSAEEQFAEAERRMHVGAGAAAQISGHAAPASSQPARDLS